MLNRVTPPPPPQLEQLSVWQIPMKAGNIRDVSREEPEFESELGKEDFSLNGNKHLTHSR